MSTTLFLTLVFLTLLAFDLCWMRHQQKKAQKHDQTLFPFCQLRRDIMKFLYENMFVQPDTLSRAEYASVRRLSDALDATIHNYNRHKTVMFDLRKMAKYLGQYRHTLKQADALELSNNPEIRKFHVRFALCLVKAFLVYTPLIRSEFVLRLVASAYRAGKKESERRIAEYVINNAEKVRQDARCHGVIEGAAV